MRSKSQTGFVHMTSKMRVGSKSFPVLQNSFFKLNILNNVAKNEQKTQAKLK